MQGILEAEGRRKVAALNKVMGCKKEVWRKSA